MILKKNSRFLVMIIALVSITILAGCLPPAEPKDECSMTILHTSDIYGRIYSRSAPDQGSVLGLSAQIARQRQLIGNNVLLLDSGDIYQTDFDASYENGAAMIAFLNAAGYDAWVPGNHDFDLGVDNIRKLATQANFSALSANVLTSDGQVPSPFQPYILQSVGNCDVAILGLALDTTRQLTKPSSVAGLQFQDPIEVAKSYVPVLRDSADVVIVLSHLDYETEQRLAMEFPEIDIIVGGNGHEAIKSPTYVGNTILVNAGDLAQYLGRIDLRVDKTNQVVKVTSDNILLQVNPDANPDAAVKNAIAPYLERSKPIGDEIIGQLEESLYLNQSSSTLGHFMTEAMLSSTDICGEAAVAVINRQTIRDDLYAGEVTYRKLFNAIPFRDDLRSFQVSGEQILNFINELGGDALIAGRDEAVNEDFWYATNSGESKIVSSEQYQLVTISFLQEHHFSHAATCQGLPLVDAVINYLAEEPPTETTFTPEVYANQGWQDTSILVEKNTHVTIKYISGLWFEDPPRQWHDASGGPNPWTCTAAHCHEPLHDFPKYALIGKVGYGNILKVGNELEFVTETDGILYLRPNYGDVDMPIFNPQGSVIVEVTLSPAE